ncbi:hypothetical protein COU01_00945 [Candidatus Falkowbacteria bacterium CG10_big_fil_rev_8_21_14_0_10_44_15]|uniref:Uncharacterized protein n=1 Tax=Candidatus Falkowbacteria bacterium CG10_big_fil_rev_8_21_14_0_10_44_15 TaxID=1974569 RepID=A0A2H0V0G6_9BACT|nr:MAG: hypothetical protein COU01_00945 [Candidatus Falkowbacteria bacterium CG10_big_fil_rev_8_21_14_0_10_44_15]
MAVLFCIRVIVLTTKSGYVGGGVGAGLAITVIVLFWKVTGIAPSFNRVLESTVSV